MDDEHRLEIGQLARRPDRVEVALHEFTVAAALRVLAAPHRRHVVALEGEPELADVLRAEPGEGHGEVEPHPHLAPPVILEVVELLVGLLAPLAGEDLEVLKRRRVDRHEAVGAVDAPGDVEDLLAGQGLGGKVVAESLQGARFDHGGGLGVGRRKAPVIAEAAPPGRPAVPP